MPDAYATLDQAREHLDLDQAGSRHDQRLEAVLDAASRAVDHYCRRHFHQVTTTRRFSPLDYELAAIGDLATTSGLVIATDDNRDGTAETTWSATDYVLEPENGTNGAGLTGWPYTHVRAVGRSWPTSTTGRRSLIHITGTFGWPAVPTEVTEATLLVAARIFRRRNSPEGIAGGAEQFGAIRISNRQDPDATLLLAPYRDAAGVAFA